MNDAKIGFRTFADEDDTTWARGEAGPRSPENFVDERPLAGSDFESLSARPRRSQTLLMWGTGLALIAGVVIAVALAPRDTGSKVAPAASQGLRVHRYVARSTRVTSSALLPCYVDGVSVGSLSLTDCGGRNGVASGRLDVGLAPAPQARPTPVEAQPPATLPPAAVSRHVSAPVRQASEDEVNVALSPQPPRTAPFAQRTRLKSSRYTLGNTPTRVDVTPRRASLDGDESPSYRLDNSGESLQAVQTFYEGLAAADGDRAASVVVPEKRSAGPLSARSIHHFYSSLRAPLRIARLYPLDDRTVMVRYSFVAPDGAQCKGAARITTTVRDGEVLVQNVRALNGC